ncbi:hypothetical protein Trydic_g11135 [Trypoxylus dichotomus]
MFKKIKNLWVARRSNKQRRIGTERILNYGGLKDILEILHIQIVKNNTKNELLGDGESNLKSHLEHLL